MAPVNVPIKEGRLTGSKRLHLALDIEKSVLETRYFEIVKSNDLEFLDLSSKITRETSDHRDTLKKKIEKG